MFSGSGGEGHFHYNFIVSPPLPDDISGIELVFKETNPFSEEKSGQIIVLLL